MDERGHLAHPEGQEAGDQRAADGSHSPPQAISEQRAVGGVEAGAPRPRGLRLTPGRRRRWAALVVGSVLLVGVVLAASVGVSRLLQPTPPLPPPLTHPRPPIELPLYRDGQTCGGECTVDQLVCPQQPQWSADGARIAILSSCDTRGYGSNKLFLYDAATGALLAKIVLDDIILQAPNVPLPLPPSSGSPATPTPSASRIPCLSNPIAWFPALKTLSVLWSPDGRRLAVPFVYTIETHDLLQGPGCPTWAGLLLMDAAGGDPQVFLQENPAAFGPCYLMWDLAQGRLVPVQRDASPFFSCLPPALGYQWKANGALASAIPLAGQGTPQTSACSPAGNPDGAASFTIWQGGSVDLVSRLGSTFHQPGAFTWNSGFTAWSPDGRYLTTQINVQGRLKPAGQPEPAQDTLVDLGLDRAPVLPVPDLAILPVTEGLAATASPASDYQSTHVEWRPDGRVLAAIGPAGDRSSPPSAAPRRVELYDCATGRKLTTLVPPDRCSAHRAVLFADDPAVVA